MLLDCTKRDNQPVVRHAVHWINGKYTPSGLAGTSALLEGLSLVAKQFEEVLQRHEIRSISAAGQLLDHAAIGEFVARQDLLRAGQVGLATWIGMLLGTVAKLAIVAMMIGIE